ncbi:extracelular serine carboxypeptidase protein [Rutstroemia sp. NJR-2017a BVV2]|nr:extracelular serine carboxypeptidase protein [Rutstroemia sp. NJR-2017a BVV2]
MNVVAGLACSTNASILTRHGASQRKDVSVSRRATLAYKPYTIDMPIDHFPNDPTYAPHTNATFKQRYFFDATYYKPGGPVYLYIGGETNAQNRFSNLQTGTIADNVYFAQHITLPGVNASIKAPDTKWILLYPEVLFGGIAASAPVKTVVGYPEWYNPIQKYAPQDCIASINGIIDKMDHLVSTNNTHAIQQLKSIFGLGELKDIRDFAMTIAFPIGGPMNYPMGTWQELNWNPSYSSDDFWNFCSNVTNMDAPESITEVDYALANYTGGEPWTNLGNYANYIKTALIPICDGAPIDSTACFGTQNQTYWAGTSNGAGRSYLYTTCLELGAYQAAPETGPSLISRVLQPDYTQQWCTWAFPPGEYNALPPVVNTTLWNQYGGFNFSAPRLAFIDGASDVWLDLCYHSNNATSPRVSSDLHPEYLITGAGHHWDSYGIKNISAEPLFIQQAHLWEIRTVKKWLKAGW